MSIQKHIEEMKEAYKVVTYEVDGLNDLINIGHHSEAELNELKQSLAEAEVRQRLLKNAIDADTALVGNGYPNPINYEATNEIIESLFERVGRMIVVLETYEEEPDIGADNGFLTFHTVD